MTTVTTLAQSLSAHPGPWNGGYGWFPFFPFFGFFFFLLFLFLVFGIFGRRRGCGARRRTATPCTRPSPTWPAASPRGRSTRRSTSSGSRRCAGSAGADPATRQPRDGGWGVTTAAPTPSPRG